jgi:ABC-type branched-subunit amino acid transport system substrate-binding protein
MADESKRQRWYVVWLVSLFQILKSWVLIPILASLVGTILITRAVANVIGPSSYTIYVVGDFGRSASERIFQVFRHEHLPRFGDVPLRVTRMDDHGDPADAARIAASISKSTSDALMVIGHVTSSQTKAALPFYLAAKPPVPVILPMETTPDLAPPKSQRVGYDPILQLSPTDDQQAQAAAEFLSTRNAKAVWVVEDTDNSVYSNYLANAFIRAVQSKNTNGEKIVLWSTNKSPPTAQAIRELNINWVFFAGRRQNGLILVTQLHAIYPTNTPNILLSDASADQDLINDGGEDVDGVYVTSPIPVTEFEREKSSEDYHNIYGDRAFAVVESLLEDANATSGVDVVGQSVGFFAQVRRFLGIRRIADARSLLIATMEAEQREGHTTTLIDGTKIRFGVDDAGNDGVRIDENAKFYIWKVNKTQNRFVEPSAL